MPRSEFYTTLQQELDRIDDASTDKRQEMVIEGFTDHENPRAIIEGKEYQLFNSNDYLGLRFNPRIREAEHAASDRFGTSPGAVRFISGTEKVYKDLEGATAQFHGHEAAIAFSSAFAANVGVIHALIKGQAKDTKVSDSTLVLSDQLNHRSIIEGMRTANLPSEQRPWYNHLEFAKSPDTAEVQNSLYDHLHTNRGKFKRALVITDGIFSMLGEYADLAQIREVTDQFEQEYEEGVLLLVDDSHGVAAFGQSGRGTEEVTNTHADILIGTYGKGFGSDGGYAVANKIIIDYLRESAATYIYSNPVSPGVAGAALEAVNIVGSPDGLQLIKQVQRNVNTFKNGIQQAGFTLASDSIHPIQPVLIGDAAKSKALTLALRERGYIVTNISYPVVPPGQDEIRVQMSAIQTEDDVTQFIDAFATTGKEIGLIS